MVSRFLILLSLLVALPALADAPTRATLGINAAAGWALFKRPWISAPSSLRGGGGLGPLYDARSCDSCHLGGGAGDWCAAIARAVTLQPLVGVARGVVGPCAVTLRERLALLRGARDRGRPGVYRDRRDHDDSWYYWERREHDRDRDYDHDRRDRDRDRR